MVLEQDDKKLAKLIAALDGMYAGLSSGLSRPDGLSRDDFDDSEIEEAERTKPRTIFAVAKYEQGKADLYRAWLGDSTPGDRGDAITQNLYVSEVHGELKIVARYRRCSTCLGKLKLPNGKTCPECKGHGWEHQSGKAIKKLSGAKEVRKLNKPTDPLSKPLYEAIEDAE